MLRGECQVPLSRLMGYYCLLLLLSSVIFARWMPSTVPAPGTPADITFAGAPAGKPAPLLVSMRGAPSVTWPGAR